MSGNNTPVGQVRPSQLLWTYGPGALIDLPNVSVMTLGIDRWNKNECQPIDETRLLAAVRRTLGPQVETLRIPPLTKDENFERFSPEALIGVPVRPFPRWLRCVKCGLLSEYDIGLIECKEHYRPELTRFVHKDCSGSKGDLKPKNADAVPARFLLACRAGHLDDFPWHYFVHSGPSSCPGTLRFFESGASLQTENLWIKCDQCNASRSMAHAFGKAGKDNLPACRGRHPHLDEFTDKCDEQARTVLLGATNSWFPITLSALAIPVAVGSAEEIVDALWDDFEDIDNMDVLKGTLKALAKRETIPGLEALSIDEIWDTIRNKQSGKIESSADASDIKGPEWKVLSNPNPPADWPHFFSSSVPAPQGFEKPIDSVLLLERLREVNALLGFTRVEAPDESDVSDERAPRANLGRGQPNWVPTSVVHGEGIFIRFNESELATWECGEAVRKRDTMLQAGHRGWCIARNLEHGKKYPGIRYAMLHTLSHLLIRELSLECGYNAASIRERIYADTNDEDKQAGILIYTAAADSDGTLGGLVHLGKPENLGRLLFQALQRAQVCSSDPLCSEHKPEKDRSLHAAACHACSFVSETSCELGNRFIDRALVIPTLNTTGAAFFGGRKS